MRGSENTEILPRLPHNLDAERAVLGGIMLDESLFGPVAATLIPSDFFLPEHQTVFRTMANLVREGKPIDLLTVNDALERGGTLEAAGGVGYLSSLMDGIPHLSNLDAYALRVKQTSTLRCLAFQAESIRLAALEPNADPETVRARLLNMASILPGKPNLRSVSAEEFLEMSIPPREMLLDPIIPTQGLAMIYSKRGVGKTYLALAIANAIAKGGGCLSWKCPKPGPVLYVDGELPAATLHERLTAVIAGAENGPAKEARLLKLITPDLQQGPMPDLATTNGQAQIEAHLDGVALLILDNLSSLCVSGKENEGESWLPVQGWALRLRQRGISVLFVHHAGKSGAQRGTSRREDLLDTVLSLRHPSDYSPAQGLRFELHFEKCRGFLGDQARPFEVKLETALSGAAVWTTRSLEDSLTQRAAILFGDGLSVRDVAEELGISKSASGRLRSRVKQEANL